MFTGFPDNPKSTTQWRNKWKALKSAYTGHKKTADRSGERKYGSLSDHEIIYCIEHVYYHLYNTI